MSSKKNIPDHELFREAMADVRPLPGDGRIDPVTPRPPARAVQQERDDREALREMLERIDLDAAETGEELQWLKPGYQPRILRRLRRGHYTINDTIDLHYMDVATARQVHSRLFRLNKAVSGASGVAGVKYAMELGGYHGGNPRLPLLPIKDADKQRIQNAAKEAGVL